MTKNAENRNRVDKNMKHSPSNKHDHHHHKHSHHHHKHSHHHHKHKKHTMNSSSPRPRASPGTGAGSSSQTNVVYTEPGPHGSISVKAISGSRFLHARSGSYAIREEAYMKEAVASGQQTLIMNCQMSQGVLVRPNIRQARFDYPDGTFLHCVPICNVKILCMRTVFGIGRGREYINSASEVYGRDSVLLQMQTSIVNKLKRHASKVYGKQYENDTIFSFGEPDGNNPNVTLIPCTAKSHAKLVANVRGTVIERRLGEVVGWDNKDIDGDALIALKYVRTLERKTAELVFELQDVIVRRGTDKLFGSSSSSS